MNNRSRARSRGIRASGSLLAVVAALCVALPPSTADAQQPTKAAQQEAASRFKKGLDLFKDGDYQAALIEFRRAYELAPNFNVLYNIGQVYFQLQDYPNALNALERYLSEGGNNVPNSRRGEVEKDIEKLKSRVANLDINVNVPDAEIALDDVPIGKSPLSKPVMVSAGKHKLVISKSGFASVTRVVEVASGETPKIPVELVENKGPVINIEPPPTATVTAPPPPTATVTAPPPAEPPPPKSIPWAGWAVTGGLTVGAVVTGVLALGASSDLKTERENGNATSESLKSASDKAKTFALVTDILAGGAIVAGGVTLYFTLASPSPPEKPKPGAPAAHRSPSPFIAPQVRVGVGPGNVALIGTF
ncbi:MAG: PEGA domain-containing protein [Byssovorax sp.]